MLELYHADRSTCSQKVRICLFELGLQFSPRPVNLVAGEQLSPHYLNINPNGVVPALVHDGAVIIESTVICEYLCEVFPDAQKPLVPENPVVRAHMRAWLRYIDEVPSMAVRVPSFQKVMLPFYRHMSDAEFERFIDAMPVRKYFFQKMGRHGFSEQEYRNAIEQLQRAFSRMERALADSDWIAGSQYSIADICMAPVLQRLEDLELADLWVDTPRVEAWFARVKARRAFASAFHAGSHFTLAEMRELMVAGGVPAGSLA